MRELVKIDSVEGLIYLGVGRKVIFVRTFHIYCPIWVNFSVRNLHIISLTGREFRGNRLQ